MKTFSRWIILALLCGLAFGPAASVSTSPAFSASLHTWTVLPLGKSPYRAVEAAAAEVTSSPTPSLHS